MTTKTRRYSYTVGRYGLVAEAQQKVGRDAWATRRILYIGRTTRAHRIVALLRKQTR